MKEQNYKLGLDVGSTTLKLVIVNEEKEVVFSEYRRHKAGILKTLIDVLKDVKKDFGDVKVSSKVTGSAGMGVSENFNIPFIQEVIGTSEYINTVHPDIDTIIDIGGEDAKLVLFEEGKSPVMRMNGNCAGGTGAFIDQMAKIIGVDVSELDSLANKSKKVYPISSRCGVFAKTDIQNLISKKVSKEDITASIFHAITNQTITSLARGQKIKPKILFCGGPFAFIPYLSKIFAEKLNITEKDYLIPKNADVIPAMGCAFSSDGSEVESISELIKKFSDTSVKFIGADDEEQLQLLFKSEKEFTEWEKEKEKYNIKRNKISELENLDCYIGIDSGSTTTKLVVIDSDENLIFDYYSKNNGDPIMTLNNGILECFKLVEKENKKLNILGSCVTGYGEDLIKASFNINFGIVETIGHYLGALKFNPKVSFILDIGGQDMKAIFIEDGAINRLEINEACSSGCGSFIETFATSLDYKIEDFAKMACFADKPSDLGTRCTVFMNSKVKQFLRTNTSVDNISAGLSYSVIKNMLYKVLKLRNLDDLGGNISVQGGTFKNKSLVKAMENLTEQEVAVTNIPELMGAFGCALYAKEWATKEMSRDLKEYTKIENFSIKDLKCKACENNCDISRYSFDNKNKFFSGNKCEKFFSNKGESFKLGYNCSAYKVEELFNREVEKKENITIGIPRTLNTYENYPFWHTFLTECGFNVELSDTSTIKMYNSGVNTVMSDNICFPAKLVHGHINNLVDKKVDRIFMPYVTFESKDTEDHNSYNCPIVSGYSDVIDSSMDLDIPLDAPSISFRDNTLLEKALKKYVKSFSKLSGSKIKKALELAIIERDEFKSNVINKNNEIYKKAIEEDRMVMLLSGRPYHHDPLIQQKISNIITEYGVDVITEDIVREGNPKYYEEQGTVKQWAYTNRIIDSANWVAKNPNTNVHFVQLSSFGCGPDAFITDYINDVLKENGKNLTMLKVDDVSNVGSLRLRIRSLVESLKFKSKKVKEITITENTKFPLFEEKDKKRTILAPFISEFYSPLVSSMLSLEGYNMETLPVSNTESEKYGLKYANNEVCYPATLVVGDLLKALDSGKYDLENTAVAITQTGGQCRATNYLNMIKKSMVASGYSNVPIISLGTSGDGVVINEQPGFKMDWGKHLKLTMYGILFADTLAKLYYSSLPRELEKGKSKELRDKYMKECERIIRQNDSKGLLKSIEEAVKEFNTIVDHNKKTMKVGIVGEIFVKFNSFGHGNVVNWLIDKGVEVIIPPIIDFGIQEFVNIKHNHKNNLEKANYPKIVYDFYQYKIEKMISKFNKIGKKFPHFVPFTKINEEAKYASEMVNISGQFGEGWLIPAEIASFAHKGVNNVVSLQPFGCIANQIVSKGIEKKAMKLYPKMNLLFLDFDSSVSEVNIHNRLHFMINNVKKEMEKECEVTY